MIDTHKEYKLLVSKGFKEEQAEAITDIMSKKNEELATKHDLKAMELVLRQEIQSLSHDFRQEIESSRHDFRQEIESLRHDFRQEIESLRHESKLIRQDQMWIKGLLLLVLGILIKNSFF